MLIAAEARSTPSTASWSHIQTISCRALHCLAWAQEAEAANIHAESSSWGCLKLALLQMLHDLLSGHLADPQIDFQAIFSDGLVLVMRQRQGWMSSVAPLNGLMTAMLQRMARDQSLSGFHKQAPQG